MWRAENGAAGVPSSVPHMTAGLDPAMVGVRDCLIDRGWEVTTREGVIYGPILPSGEMAAYEKDQDECAEAAGLIE
nr:hypothetical protein GCM10025730_42400 [Promicromonospora thailandica]